MAQRTRRRTTSDRPRIRRTQSKPPLYQELAPLFDRLYSWKDYPSEARRLSQLAHQYGRSGGNDWLDVACGTGLHLEYLRRRFRCTGVDSSRAMLKVARARLPDVPLRVGDMRTFDLGRKFDVISCLFSAIGHLPSEREVERAFRNFARHLKVGGVIFIEPWVDPRQYVPGRIHFRAVEEPDLKLARVVYSDRRNDFAILRSGYVLARRRGGIRLLRETDRMRLIPHARLVRLLQRTGLAARYLRGGLLGGRGANRGLLVGVLVGTPARGMSTAGRIGRAR